MSSLTVSTRTTEPRATTGTVKAALAERRETHDEPAEPVDVFTTSAVVRDSAQTMTETIGQLSRNVSGGAFAGDAVLAGFTPDAAVKVERTVEGMGRLAERAGKGIAAAGLVSATFQTVRGVHEFQSGQRTEGALDVGLGAVNATGAVAAVAGSTVGAPVAIGLATTVDGVRDTAEGLKKHDTELAVTGGVKAAGGLATLGAGVAIAAGVVAAPVGAAIALGGAVVAGGAAIYQNRQAIAGFASSMVDGTVSATKAATQSISNVVSTVASPGQWMQRLRSAMTMPEVGVNYGTH